MQSQATDFILPNLNFLSVNENNNRVDMKFNGSDSKESACNAEDLGSVPGSGRSPGEGNRKPLYYSCLENPMYRRAWQATVHRVTKSQTRLSD